MRAPLVALLLVALTAVTPFATPEASTQAATVPGTDRPDLLGQAAREWRLEDRLNHQVDLLGIPELHELLWLAVRIHGERGILETAAVTTQDNGSRFEPVFNVGAAISSIRFDPPLVLGDGAEIATVHPARLPWQEPTLENQSRNGSTQQILETETPLVHPQDNDTSPPIAWTQNESDAGPATGRELKWRIELQERPPGDGPNPHSPGAIRFSWNLTSSAEGPFSPEQEVLWRFRFDYETLRSVVRPDVAPPAFDGATLVANPHRSALRLAPYLTPISNDGAPGEALGSTLDAYSGIDGASIEADPTAHPPPVIVESRTLFDGQDDLRGLSLAGELAFMTAATQEGPTSPPPPDPPKAYPAAPSLWMPIGVLVLALMLLVRRGPR